MTINKSLLQFLTELGNNNNKEWFDINRKRYEAEKADFTKIISHLFDEVAQFENLEGLTYKNCSFRINRDIRFSANKSPYKRNFSCSFEEGGRKSGKAGYYLHIEPGNCFIGGGAWGPTKDQTVAIRQEIDYNPKPLLDIINNPSFINIYGQILGDGLKTAPKGYEKDHVNIDLIRKNQWFVWHKYTDSEVLKDDFLEKVIAHCKVMKPLTDWINLVCFE